MPIHSLSRSERGFSLIELMMTVAIVGVLASIAVSKYQNYIRIIRVNTAKMHLSSLYAMEKGFYAEYMAYTSRLDAIGYGLEGKVYFNIGFRDDFPPPLEAPQGTATCTMVCRGLGTNHCPGSSQPWQCMTAATFNLDGNIVGSVGGGLFTATAHSHFGDMDGIGPEADPITLTINQNKEILEHANAN